MRAVCERRPVALLVAAIAACYVAAPAPAHAELDGDEYASEDFAVRMTVPLNWQATEQTSYPNILLWMVRLAPQKGKMLLSAEVLTGRMSSRQYATKTIELLEKLGYEIRAPTFHSSTGAYYVDYDNGRVYLRQAFLVTGGYGYSLTLATPSVRARATHARAFDQALRSIKPNRKRAAPAPDGEGAPDDTAEPNERTEPTGGEKPEEDS